MTIGDNDSSSLLALDAIPLSASVPLPSLEEMSLPLPATRIPPTVQSLAACAAHEIDVLTAKQEESAASLSPDEEDALDDGFFLCDLQTVHTKLALWCRSLFPSVKPFFALKCHPDPMIAAVLGQANGAAGFDCASLAEIQLAIQSSSSSARARNIVYANPQRAEDALARAAGGQVLRGHVVGSGR